MPFKQLGTDEGEDEAYALTLSVGYAQIQKGNKHPHVRAQVLNFVHDTAFTAFQCDSDSSEDEGEENDLETRALSQQPRNANATADSPQPVGLEEELVHLPFQAAGASDCCGLECGARGLPCTFAMFREMERGLQEVVSEPTALPEEAPPIPPPVCGPACGTGSCNSMHQLANKSQGRFRRARRVESLGRLREKNEPEFLKVPKDLEGEEPVSFLKDPESKDKWVESMESLEGEMEMESPDAHQKASSTDELLRNLCSEGETCHQSKVVQKEPTEEELEEEIEVDDAQSINYWELSEAFRPSLRAPLLTRAQPGRDDELPQQAICRWPFIPQSLNSAHARDASEPYQDTGFHPAGMAQPQKTQSTASMHRDSDKVRESLVTRSPNEDQWRYEELLNDEDSVQSETRQDHQHLMSFVQVLEGEAFSEVHLTQTPGATSDYRKIEIALDSGAGEHVASRKVAADYEVEESAGSRAGQHFIAAGGTRIQNEGQFTLEMRSGGLEKKKGRDIKSTFQVAKVIRPLWSVGRICDEGFEVKFTNTEAYVMTKEGK